MQRMIFMIFLMIILTTDSKFDMGCDCGKRHLENEEKGLKNKI